MTAPVWSTVMVTGHRPQHLRPDSLHDWVRGELDRLAVKLRDDHGMTGGVSGMAIGSDLWWADSLVRAGVPLWAHVPFPQQAVKWTAEQRAEWERLLRLARKVKTYGGMYAVKFLHERNDGMLAAADLCVAVWQPSKRDGGTFSAVEKAYRRRLPLILVNPEARAVTMPTRQRLAVLLGKTLPQPHQPA